VRAEGFAPAVPDVMRWKSFRRSAGFRPAGGGGPRVNTTTTTIIECMEGIE
jgi:hypothetical protein